MTKYISEFMGTCALTLAVLGALLIEGSVTPIVVAGLTLGVFAATVGKFSGAHLNPAITVAALSLKRISAKDSLFYILAQFAGAALAVLLARITEILPPLEGTYSHGVLLAEFVGTVFFSFGVASIMFSRTTPVNAPLIVGGSLIIGGAAAITLGSNAVLNPAVAFGLGSFGIAYIVGPVLGALAGAWIYRSFVCEYCGEAECEHNKTAEPYCNDCNMKLDDNHVCPVK